MTTKLEKPARCAICGAETVMLVLGSSNSFGSMDLDLRPPPMIRWENDMFVQCCPQCKYCAADVEQAAAGITRSILEQPDYLSLVGSDDPPPAYRQFLAAAYLAEVAGGLVAATWSAVRAAWSCDDSDDQAGAVACRIRAVELGRRAVESGQVLAADGATHLVLADLLRRAGRFDEAREGCLKASTEVDANLMPLVEFELQLATAEDGESHRLDEAPGWG